MNWRGFLRSQFSSAPSRNQRRLAAHRRASSANFEALEQRTMLAGDVTATLIGQTAFLTGDSLANQIEVSVQDGNVVVAGLDNTTINGSSEAFVLAEGTNQLGGSLLVSLGRGNDEFNLEGVQVGGFVRVDGGSGNDVLRTSESASVGHSLIMIGGSGSNQLGVSETTIGGNLRMYNGRGQDLMAVVDSTIAGSFIAFGGRGSDDIVLDNSTVSRNVRLYLGSGSDDVAMSDSTIGRRFIVYGGRGSDVVYAEDTNVGRGSVMVLGSGRDRVSIQGESSFSGRTIIAGGRKSDVIEVAETASVSKLRRSSIKFGTVASETLDQRITGAGGAFATAAALTGTTTALQLSVSDATISESGGAAASILTVTRIGDTSAALEVNVQSGNTSRLQLAETTITIPAGAESATVSLNAIDDSESNGQETVVLTATSIGVDSQTIAVTVTDDESAALSLSATSPRVTEDSDGAAETVNLTVFRTSDTTGALSVDLTYALDDGSAATSVLTGPATAEFAAGASATTVTLTTVPNTTAADDVTVTVTATNGADSQTIDITVEDNDKDRLSVRFDTLTVVEDGPPATMTISRTSDTTEALDITLESGDVSRINFGDQSIIALVIPAGASSITRTVSAVDNDVVEGNLDVTLTVTAQGFESGANTIEVVDNDSLELTLTVEGSATFAEDSGTATGTFTVARNSADLSQDLVVTVSTSGDDRLSVPATVTIPAGQASVAVNVDAIDNDFVDNPATGTTILTATATGFQNADIELSVTNDDVATTFFDPTSIVVSEDQGTAQVTIKRNSSVGAETVNLSYSDSTLLSGPASVQFADGESELNFSATITDNELFTNNATVTVTGSVLNQPDIVLNVDVANDDILAVTTNLASNQIEDTVGGKVTKESSLTVTGTTEPGATVNIDSDGDGEFDDGSTTADTSGNYTVDVTLLRDDTNLGVNRIQAEAILAAAPGSATSDTTFVHLAVGTLVRFQTNYDPDGDGTGEFYDIELFDEDAPNTVDNFLDYVNDGTYENNIIHRSINNFVIQGGGFELTDSGVERVTTRGTIEDEFSSDNLNVRGTLSMAHTGQPNSGSSQWFFNVQDNPGLNTASAGVPHTVFGRVIGSGVNVITDINLNITKADLSLRPNLGAFATTPLSQSPYQSLTGTVSVTSGSRTITGAGTSFTSELAVGDIIAVDSNVGSAALPALRVVSVISDTELTVDVASDGNATERTLFRQVEPALDHYILFTNIGEILDTV